MIGAVAVRPGRGAAGCHGASRPAAEPLPIVGPGDRRDHESPGTPRSPGSSAEPSPARQDQASAGAERAGSGTPSGELAGQAEEADLEHETPPGCYSRYIEDTQIRA